MNSWVEQAAAEVVTCLRRKGLAADRWSVLSDSNRLIFGLEPCESIAKVVPIESRHELVAELAVAKHAERCGANVARPDSRVEIEPHCAGAFSGNLMRTSEGPLWLDFEAACAGPVEWDLSALPDPAGLPHDPDLLTALVRLRRACVVAWCRTKQKMLQRDVEAADHHLRALRDQR